MNREHFSSLKLNGILAYYHYLNKNKSSCNIVIKVLQRFLDTFAYRFEISEVNTCFKRILCKYRFKSCLISNIYLIKGISSTPTIFATPLEILDYHYSSCPLPQQYDSLHKALSVYGRLCICSSGYWYFYSIV